jgi:hypothetical protein
MGREAIMLDADKGREGEGRGKGTGEDERWLNLLKNMHKEEEDGGFGCGGDSRSLFISVYRTSHNALAWLRTNLCIEDVRAKLTREHKFRDD